MSVDGANTQDMLFLARLFEIGSARLSLQALATQLVSALIEGLDADIAVLMQVVDGQSRPLAWRGVELDESLTFEHDVPFTPEIPIRTALVLPLVHTQKTLGSLHIYTLESRPHPSRLLNGSQAPYNQAFLQAISHSIASSLYIQALHEQESRAQFKLQGMIDSIPSAVMLFDSERNVVLANKEARGMVGLVQWDQIGDASSNPFRICDPLGQELPRSEWPFLKAIRLSSKSTNQEYLLDFGTFQRHVLISVSPIRMNDSEPFIFVATAEDITLRVEQDQRKDDFLTVASHELRSPLTPLIGFMQMARHQAEAEQTVDINVLLRAERQAHRIRRLIEGLLDFSRIETGRLQLFCRQLNLVELLTHVLEPWHPSQDTQSSFQVTLPTTPLLASIDPDRLEQVITNIIDNAIKHGRSDGVISVALFQQDDQAVLTISDEGDGIDPLELELVFERFYQRGKRGTKFRTSMGLGLYISRQIIEQHGGTIEMQSTPGLSTTVRICLPLLTHPTT